MEDLVKSRIVLASGLVCLVLLLFAFGSCSNAKRYRLSLDKEKASSWDLAQKIEEMKRLDTNLEAGLKAKTQELEEEKAAHQASKKALLQEQLLNKSLKEELEKVVKLKEALEEDLKEALVSGKAAKKK